MDLIAMKHFSIRTFGKDAPVLLRRKRLTSNGEVLETQDFADSVVIGHNIFRCVLNSDENALKTYLKSGKNPNIRTKHGNSLLHLAVEAGDTDIVEMLLCDDRCLIDTINDLGQTPLMYAITLNDLDLVKRLIKTGADVEVRDRTGKTSLLIALQDCNYDIADYLIKNGSDVNVTDALGHSAMFILINTLDKGCLRMASKLLKADYSLDKDKEWLKEEGLDIEISKTHNCISRVLRKVTCGVNLAESSKSTLSFFSNRQSSESNLHVMMIDRKRIETA
ncbi:ankyrin repeat domain-containing protein 35-like [Ostrea edulis]|uniref:ankyrin repeat domain-containing protein 35-like n=1 Tax=Ostrea edulis TaxID=37623 RepID=UPI0024AFEF1D|nr:ankyrin repeat domain-containing protein 35-like [Ostrea edulis]